VLKAGETLLVHGGSSGIGVTAIQLAHALGSRVIVTVGSAEKGAACLQLGAARFINYKTSDFEQELADEKVDVILDMVGGEYLPKNLRILREEGRLVYINTMGGSRIELDISTVMRKRLTITGSTLRSREYAFKKSLTSAIEEHVWPLLNNGKFKPVIYRTFPFEEVATAHELMESSEHIGKIVLTQMVDR
jgi:NADPH:quinone reductase-like Zn-dependent oxidoreductase